MGLFSKTSMTLEKETTPASGGPPSHPAARPAPPPGWARLSLVCVIAFSSLADLWHFSGFYGSDDRGYLQAARRVLEERSLGERPELGMIRLTIVGWNALMISTIAANAQVVAASYILLHQVMVTLTYLLARRLFDWRVGLLAAIGAGLTPLVVAYSSCILPDIPAGIGILASLYAFVRAEEARRASRPRSAWAWMLGAGVAVGVAYMAKESALILLPFYFAFWLITARPPWRRAAIVHGAAFAIGFFGMLAAETAALSALTGKLFFRLTWTVEDLDPSVRAHIARYGDRPAERFDWLLTRLNDDFVPRGSKYAIAAGVVLFPLLVRRGWSVLLLALWGVGYQTWGSMRWTEYFPPSIQARYYIPFVPLLAIVVSAVWVRAAELAARWLPRRVAKACWWGAAGLFVGCQVWSLRGLDEFGGKAYRADWVDSVVQAIDFAKLRPDSPVVLSRQLSLKTDALFMLQKPGAALTDFDLTLDVLRDLFTRPQWLYVETDPQTLSNRMDAGGKIDPLLHRVMGQTDRGAIVDTLFPDVRPIWSLDPSRPDAVEFDAYRLEISLLTPLQAPLSRWQRLAPTLFNNPPLNPEPDPSAARLLVYRVQGRALPRVMDDMGASIMDYELRAARWNAEGAVIEVGGGGLRLESDPFAERPGEAAADRSSEFEIEARTACVVTVEVEEVEEVADALTGRLSLYATGVGGAEPEPLEVVSAELAPGENRIEIAPAPFRRTCAPGFRVRGPASICRVTVELRPADPPRDLLTTVRRYGVGAAKDATVTRDRNALGGPIVTVSGNKSYIWLMPSVSRPLPELEIPPHTRFDFWVDARFSEAMEVTLLMDAYDDPQRTELAVAKRTPMVRGLNRFGVQNGERRRFVRVYFKIFGDGDLSIERFDLLARGD